MERNHQGLENRLIVPLEIIDTGTAVLKKRERLGGLLNYYYREESSGPRLSASRLRMETVELGMALCDLGIVPSILGFIWASSDSLCPSDRSHNLRCEVCRSA
jgi:hypothetical protein